MKESPTPHQSVEDSGIIFSIQIEAYSSALPVATQPMNNSLIFLNKIYIFTMFLFAGLGMLYRPRGIFTHAEATVSGKCRSSGFIFSDYVISQNKCCQRN